MDIEKILSQMTLEEKVSLLQGRDSWHTVPVERLGLPSIMVSDGPHGLRKMYEDAEGKMQTITSVCFPSAAGTASSFDPELLEFLGENLGQECQAEDIGVLLGPAANIKRSPLCGRNFEYFSEDPVLSGDIAAAWIRGLQSQGVGCSLKHFAANNQETMRMCTSAKVSQRALREIYLANFERAVKGGKPWTVMCSYNKINGAYSSENRWLLTDVLRNEWGFDGAVMTDWGACNDHVKGIAAGLELEMPREGDDDDQAVVEAVRRGEISEETVTEAARRMLKLIDRVVSNHREGEELDCGMHHHMARRIARESMVLLKNDGDLLPIRGNKKVAFIGEFAEKPRFEGGGSSYIRASEVHSALQAVRSVSAVTYAKGFVAAQDAPDPMLEKEAVEAACQADIAVLFVGLPDKWESEGYDRAVMDLPENQLSLIRAVTAVQKNVAVVLHNGSPVTMPWVDSVPAILEAYLGGQAGGAAVVDLLFGAVSPCGKLAETFPLRIEDTPAYLNFPGDGTTVDYAEGIYVGYRYYDKRRMQVLFPFGHGLSYTTFVYSNLRLSANETDGDLTVSVDITNTGRMMAKEAVQLYIRPDHPGKDRPVRELKAFGKVLVMPGKTETVTFALTRRDFSYWEERIDRWFAEPGLYQIEAAASSRDIRLTAPVTITGEPLRLPVTSDTAFGTAYKIPGAPAILDKLMNLDAFDPEDEACGGAMAEAMLQETPLNSCATFTNATRQDVRDSIEKLNELLKKL